MEFKTNHSFSLHFNFGRTWSFARIEDSAKNVDKEYDDYQICTCNVDKVYKPLQAKIINFLINYTIG